MPSSGTTATGIFCPAGRWTQVEWFTGTFGLTKRYIVTPGVSVQWRYFSAGIPPYWANSFVGSACITLPAGVYTSLEFNPSTDVTVTFSVFC